MPSLNKMKWNVQTDVEGKCFLAVNGIRCITSRGNENVIRSAAPGNNKEEIWFKLEGELLGKRLRRTDFDFENSSREFAGTASNNDFLRILQDMGIDIGRRHCKKKGPKSTNVPEYPDIDPTPDNGKNKNGEFENLKAKCAGQFNIRVDCITPPPACMKLRTVDPRWVQEIKQFMRETPAKPVTRLPLLLNPESYSGSQPNLEEDTSLSFFSLGGNHLLQAMQQLHVEAPEDFKCLRYINADVYTGLSDTEALFIAAWHNKQCQNRDLTFQEKVRIARKSFTVDKEDWKDRAVVTLGYISKKDYTKEVLGTVLSVAGYGELNWGVTEKIFSSYEMENRSSFPQNLFKILQGVSEEKRTPYLAKAIGTNGVKVAKTVTEDKNRENMKDMICHLLNQDSWDDVDCAYLHSSNMLDFNGNLKTPEGRSKFCTHVMNLAKADYVEPQFEVMITIKRNGTDVTGAETDLITLHKNKIIKTMLKKKIVSEE